MTTSKETHIVFGNAQGLVYQNNQLLVGSSKAGLSEDIASIAVNNNYVYAGTRAGNVWRYDTTENSVQWIKLGKDNNSMSDDGCITIGSAISAVAIRKEIGVTL